MALEYFPCYHSYLKKIEKLSDQEVGRLFRSLLKYSDSGETEELTGRESIAFDFIVADIDRAKEEYSKKCEKNRANAYERYRPHTNDCETCQNKSKSKSKSKSNNITPPYNPPSLGGETDGQKYSDAFLKFWSAYPKKVGKLDAFKSFKKVRAPVDVLIAAVLKQSGSDQWKRNNGQYIPNPSTWLNQGRWEDETTNAAPGAHGHVDDDFNPDDIDNIQITR